MSSDTNRYHTQHDDLKSLLNRILWRLLDWNPNVFELYSSLAWIIWGIWMISIPSEAHGARYGVMFRYIGPQTLGAALLIVGVVRLSAIVASHFRLRHAMSFIAAVGWGGIALLLLWSSLNITAISHLIFALVSGWSYLRLRE